MYYISRREPQQLHWEGVIGDLYRILARGPASLPYVSNAMHNSIFRQKGLTVLLTLRVREFITRSVMSTMSLPAEETYLILSAISLSMAV